MPEISWLKPFVELGSFALVAWVMWHVFNNLLPKQQEQFITALKEQHDDYQKQQKAFQDVLQSQRDQFLKALETQDSEFAKVAADIRVEITKDRETFEKRCQAQTRSIERLTVALIYHDSTVRGVNPETLGSTQELLRMLRAMDEDFDNGQQRKWS